MKCKLRCEGVQTYEACELVRRLEEHKKNNAMQENICNKCNKNVTQKSNTPTQVEHDSRTSYVNTPT